ncbi:MAG: hypothetical protein J5886_06470 [Bacteroidales bacterium]|nr:hypothetical protein [Bacteroidales bacterium]
MKDYNRKNLKRLLSLFTAALVVFLSVVTVCVSLRFWWASIPTSISAVTAAALLFWLGFVKQDQEKP